MSNAGGPPEPSLSVQSRRARMEATYNIPCFRAPIVSASTNVAPEAGTPALSLAPRDGHPYPDMRLAPVQQGLGIQPELVRCPFHTKLWFTKFTLPIVQVYSGAEPRQYL